MTREIRVHDMTTSEVVHRVDVTGKSDTHVERSMAGMLINMDQNKFYISDSADDSRDEE